MDHNYFVYILTNKNKTVVYTGVTNNLEARLRQHIENKENKFAFTYNTTAIILFTTNDFNILKMQLSVKKKLKAGQGQKRMS
ncbi:GIY-YIG nuclease family protein [Pedobacter jeongneungensis]|uniref:GIY-YIG nuclease family protein n=1 Tax=Pedobacter jeongneungensis TaxID=947309 RepID=UPI001F06FAAD|nr:GIY-YIG nuclease family protein [Pedobacter jeongneungensis]